MSSPVFITKWRQKNIVTENTALITAIRQQNAAQQDMGCEPCFAGHFNLTRKCSVNSNISVCFSANMCAEMEKKKAGWGMTAMHKKLQMSDTD